ncbi:MAG: hypothetical protein L3J10_02200 [Sulfurimonas sp.]|nr:hypothetical protein [Sulfurimonas sp.]
MKKLTYLSLVASSFLLADTDIEQSKMQVNKQQQIIQKNESVQILHTHEVHEKDEESKYLKYIPDILLISDFSYVNRNKKDSEIIHLEIPGIVHGLLGEHSDGGNTHSTYNANNGLNLNYVELLLSSDINPFFAIDSTIHFSEDVVEIEELFFTSTILDSSVKIKGGKFLSNFGNINEKHHHVWSFSDMPLVYESFLGLHGINEIGLQLQWIAPIDTYLMVGVEILEGKNEHSFGHKMLGDDASPIAKETNIPSLFIAYIKSSFNIYDTSINGGISYANADARLDHSSDEDPSVFSGDSELYGVDLQVKHYFGLHNFLSWQSELLIRNMKGNQYTLDPNNTTLVTDTAHLDKKQAGFYTQLEYGFNKNYKTAIRYDTIYKNDVLSDGINLNEPVSLNKYSAMIEYQMSQYAKFRLQYNHNEALYNEDGLKQKINTLIFQVNISIGTHNSDKHH